MKLTHVNLANGGWNTLSLMEQMANVGSEVERAISWKQKGQKEMSQRALYRGLELLDLTKMSQVGLPGMKEISRVRELLLDSLIGENRFGILECDWQKYFLSFAVGLRK